MLPNKKLHFQFDIYPTYSFIKSKILNMKDFSSSILVWSQIRGKHWDNLILLKHTTVSTYNRESWAVSFQKVLSFLYNIKNYIIKFLWNETITEKDSFKIWLLKNHTTITNKTNVPIYLECFIFNFHKSYLVSTELAIFTVT